MPYLSLDYVCFAQFVCGGQKDYKKCAIWKKGYNKLRVYKEVMHFIDEK